MDAHSKSEVAHEKANLATSPRLYIAVLALVACVGFAANVINHGVFACPVDGYGDDWYLSYCNAAEYGDFDHGAIWFALPPKVTTHIRQADALFVGSSRLQHALSTRITESFFDELDATYFLLGFSHTENSLFTGPLLDKVKPTPKVLVINVDRFFAAEPTEPAAQIFDDPRAERGYRIKHLWQAVHRAICGTFDLCGNNFAMFRNVTTGQWQGFGSTGNAQSAEVTVAPVGEQKSWPVELDLARSFIDEFDLDEQCIVLTLVPTVASPVAEAQWLADQLGMVLIRPTLDGLHTFDRSHLDEASAGRWSRAFFAMAGERIDQCLDPNAAGQS